MINYNQVMHIEFLKKLPFKGSDCGMRFMLRAVRDPEDSKKITGLEAFNWPEPLCFEKTPEETLCRETFDFSEDGIRAALEWLNEQHEIPERKALWNNRLYPDL